MKKVIDGKIYNTDTADEIACGGNDLSPGDFGYCDEWLHKTKKGAWFVYGEGGPASRWAKSCQGGRCDGDGIEVLTEAEALHWCEVNNVSADTVAKYFKVEEA